MTYSGVGLGRSPFGFAVQERTFAKPCAGTGSLVPMDRTAPTSKFTTSCTRYWIGIAWTACGRSRSWLPTASAQEPRRAGESQSDGIKRIARHQVQHHGICRRASLGYDLPCIPELRAARTPWRPRLAPLCPPRLRRVRAPLRGCRCGKGGLPLPAPDRRLADPLWLPCGGSASRWLGSAVG